MPLPKPISCAKSSHEMPVRSEYVLLTHAAVGDSNCSVALLFGFRFFVVIDFFCSRDFPIVFAIRHSNLLVHSHDLIRMFGGCRWARSRIALRPDARNGYQCEGSGHHGRNRVFHDELPILCLRRWSAGGKLASFQPIHVKIIVVSDFGPMTGRVPSDAFKDLTGGQSIFSAIDMSCVSPIATVGSLS